MPTMSKTWNNTQQTHAVVGSWQHSNCSQPATASTLKWPLVFWIAGSDRPVRCRDLRVPFGWWSLGMPQMLGWDELRWVVMYRTGDGISIDSYKSVCFLGCIMESWHIEGGGSVQLLEVGRPHRMENGNKKAWCRIFSQGICVSAFRFDITMSSCNLWWFVFWFFCKMTKMPGLSDSLRHLSFKHQGAFRHQGFPTTQKRIKPRDYTEIPSGSQTSIKTILLRKTKIHGGLEKCKNGRHVKVGSVILSHLTGLTFRTLGSRVCYVESGTVTLFCLGEKDDAWKWRGLLWWSDFLNTVWLTWIIVVFTTCHIYICQLKSILIGVYIGWRWLESYVFQTSRITAMCPTTSVGWWQKIPINCCKNSAINNISLCIILLHQQHSLWCLRDGMKVTLGGKWLRPPDRICGAFPWSQVKWQMPTTTRRSNGCFILSHFGWGWRGIFSPQIRVLLSLLILRRSPVRWTCGSLRSR